jgi:hypothetical protein
MGGDSTRVVHPLFQVGDGGSIPTSPLQLFIGQISIDLAIELNRIWHSRLPQVDKSNVSRTRFLMCFGAEFGNIWYASAIWTNPIARLLNDRPWLELRRFAIAPDAPKNTASRMLKVMTRVIRNTCPNVTHLISYQDEAVHTGTIYKAAGWTVANRMTGESRWDRPSRKRKETQAPSPKTRGECQLR